jgi:hypothetical protein
MTISEKWIECTALTDITAGIATATGLATGFAGQDTRTPPDLQWW